MRISDWSSDVCSSDLVGHVSHVAGVQPSVLEAGFGRFRIAEIADHHRGAAAIDAADLPVAQHRAVIVADFHLHVADRAAAVDDRSEEHTSELQSLMRISYAVFCLKKKK